MNKFIYHCSGSASWIKVVHLWCGRLWFDPNCNTPKFFKNSSVQAAAPLGLRLACTTCVNTAKISGLSIRTAMWRISLRVWAIDSIVNWAKYYLSHPDTWGIWFRPQWKWCKKNKKKKKWPKHIHISKCTVPRNFFQNTDLSLFHFNSTWTR